MARVLHTEYERSTVLVELDLRPTPRLTAGDVPRAPGLHELLGGEAPLQQCIVWVQPGLGVVSGGGVGDAAEMLTRFRCSTVLADLRDAGHSVIADLPPLPPHGGADRVLDVFPQVLLVVRAGFTSLPALRAAVKSVDPPPTVLLNRRSSAVPGWLRRPLGL